MDNRPQEVPLKQPGAQMPTGGIVTRPGAVTPQRPGGANVLTIVLTVVGIIALLVVLTCGGIGYFIYTKFQQAKKNFNTLTQNRPRPGNFNQPPWQPTPNIPPNTTPINSIDSAIEALKEQHPFRQEEGANYLASQPVDSAKQSDIVNSFIPLLSDFRRRDQARRVLEKWATASDVPKLIGVAQNAHTKGDRDTQRLAIGLLTKLGDARAGDAFARYYGTRHDIFAARRAMESIGASAVPHLALYLNDADHSLRQTARDLLTQQKADAGLLIQQSVRDLQTNDSTRQREAAKWLAEHVASEDDLESLAPMVSDALLVAMGTREVRPDAARALEFWATADTVPGLVKAARVAHTAQDRDGERAIIQLLTKFNDEAALMAYVDYASTHHDSGVAQNAFSKLGDTAAPALLTFIHDPNYQAQQMARALLVEWETPAADWVTQSVADLGSSDANRQRTAAQWLADAEVVADERGSVSAALVPLLSNLQLRGDAMRALKKWADSSAVPALLPLLNQQDYFLRQEALAILVATKDPRIIEPLTKNFGDFHSRHDVKRHLLAMGPVAEAALFPYVTNNDWVIAKEACEVLKEIGTRKALPSLQKAAASQQPFVRGAAEEAIKAILEAKREPVTIAANVGDPTAAPSQIRKWTDATGKNTIEAEFVELKDDKVRLKRKDGKFLSLPLENLSAADRKWVKENAPN